MEYPGIIAVGAASVGSGGGSGAADALISDTVAGLGVGPFEDGQVATVRVGAWPDREYVELTRDNDADVWVSKPRSIVSQADQSYMGVNSAGLTYIGTNNAGATTGSIGWTTRPIRRVEELYAAGLKLQIRCADVMFGQAANAFTVRPRFFLHDDGETVTFSADGSTALAEVAAVVSPATATITFKAPGWKDLVLLGTSNVVAAVNVTKANLWPRLYGSIPAGGYGSAIDFDLEYRWVA
jgi:hypothetical protein